MFDHSKGLGSKYLGFGKRWVVDCHWWACIFQQEARCWVTNYDTPLLLKMRGSQRASLVSVWFFEMKVCFTTTLKTYMVVNLSSLWGSEVCLSFSFKKKSIGNLVDIILPKISMLSQLVLRSWKSIGKDVLPKSYWA